MNLRDVYDQIQDPIKNPNNIKKLLDVYSKSGDFYSNLVCTVQKENKGRYYIADADRVYSMLFNKWKNSIVAMTRDEFVALYKKGSYGADFPKMRNYLLRVKDVTTKKEADEIIYGNKDDKELSSALEKYCWQSLGEFSGWEHVCSRLLTAKKDVYPNVEHRLYLNIDALDTLKVVECLLHKYEKYHMPFYFKFDSNGGRDDSLVIYCSSENLIKHIEILKEIKKDNPDLISRLHEPPVLTGVIDGWIGYGSEPSQTSDGKNQSFNEVRTRVLKEAISSCVKKWTFANRHQYFPYNNKRATLEDILAINLTDKFINKLIKKYNEEEKYEIKRAEREKRKVNPNVGVNLYGYTLNELKSPVLRSRIYNIVRSKIDVSLTKLCNGTYRDVEDITIKVKNGKEMKIIGLSLEEVMKEFSPSIIKYDKNFLTTLEKSIKVCAVKEGIDTEKFCFDKRLADRIKKINSSSKTIKERSNVTMDLFSMKKELYDYYMKIQKEYFSHKNEEKYRIKFTIVSKIYETISSMNNEKSIRDYLTEIKNSSLEYQKMHKDLLSKYNKETNMHLKNKMARELNEYASRISAYNESYNIIKKCFSNKVVSTTNKVVPNNQNKKQELENADTLFSDRIISLLEKYNDLDKNTTEAKRIYEEVYNLRVQRENRFKELYGRNYRIFISEIESIENMASMSFKEKFRNRTLNQDEFVSELRNAINAINEYYFIDNLRIKKYYKRDNNVSDGKNEIKFFKIYNNYLRKFHVLISSLFNNRNIVFKVNGNDITTEDLLSYLETCNIDGDFSVYKSKFSGSFIGNEEANKKKYLETLTFLNICINTLCDLVKNKINNRKIEVIDNEMTFKDFIKKRNDKLNEIYYLKQSGKLDSRESTYER